MIVSKFRGEYAFLSNFYTCPVPYKGVVYKHIPESDVIGMSDFKEN